MPSTAAFPMFLLGTLSLCLPTVYGAYIPGLSEAGALDVHAHNPIPLTSDPLRYEHYSAVTDTDSGGVSEYSYAIRVVPGLLPLAASLPTTARVVCTSRAVSITLRMPVSVELQQNLAAAQYLVARAQRIGVDDAASTGCLSPMGNTGYRSVLHVDMLPQLSDVDTMQIIYVTRPAGINEVLEPGSTLRIRHRPSKPTVVGAIDRSEENTSESDNRPPSSDKIRTARQAAEAAPGGDTCTVSGRSRANNRVCEERRYGGRSCADNTDSTDCAGYFDNVYGVTSGACPCRGECTDGSCLVGPGCDAYVSFSTTAKCRKCPRGGCGMENTCLYSHNNECNEERYGGDGCLPGTDKADCDAHVHARFGVARRSDTAARNCFCLSQCKSYPLGSARWCKVPETSECQEADGYDFDSNGSNGLDPDNHRLYWAYCDTCNADDENDCSGGNTCENAHNHKCDELRYSGGSCADGTDTADCSAFLAGDFGVARVQDERSSEVAFLAGCRCRAQCDKGFNGDWCRVDASEESCKEAKDYQWSSKQEGYYWVRCLQCKGAKCSVDNDCLLGNDGVCNDPFFGGRGCKKDHDSVDCNTATSADLETIEQCHCLSLCHANDDDLLVCAVAAKCESSVPCGKGTPFPDDTRCGKCKGNGKLKHLINIKNDPSSDWPLFRGQWHGQSKNGEVQADASFALDCVGCGVEVHLDLELTITFRGLFEPDFNLQFGGSVVPRVVLRAVAEGTITWDHQAAVPFISKLIDKLNTELAVDLGPVGLAIRPTFGLDYHAQLFADANMTATAGMQVALNMTIGLASVSGQLMPTASFSSAHQLIGPDLEFNGEIDLKLWLIPKVGLVLLEVLDCSVAFQPWLQARFSAEGEVQRGSNGWTASGHACFDAAYGFDVELMINFHFFKLVNKQLVNRIFHPVSSRSLLHDCIGTPSSAPTAASTIDGATTTSAVDLTTTKSGSGDTTPMTTQRPPTTSATAEETTGCNAHSDCFTGYYCASGYGCAFCGECSTYHDPIDGQCPPCASTPGPSTISAPTSTERATAPWTSHTMIPTSTVSGTTVAEGEDCYSHEDCRAGGYCATTRYCFACYICSYYEDSITGVCPSCTTTTTTAAATTTTTVKATTEAKNCNSHDDCGAGAYCATNRYCYACLICLYYEDPITGTCPSCTSTTTTAAAATTTK